ncbi:MAG: putative aminotransferase [Chlorobi bacterium]|nr:putative aminotransferase [Chlorobiota bacterium]
MQDNLRDLFLIRPDVAFLNHGSFGACPAPVFEEYQRWQRELESQPVEFLGRRFASLLRDARAPLAEYLNADADDLVYITNATVGVNIVARSLKLGPGDEVLATNHEYGACDRAWRFLCGLSGAAYRHAEIPVPVTTHEDLVESLFAQVGPATRVIFISHITSPTALTFPIAEICRRARALGLITIVDGAHAPGQIPLDLAAIDPDFYTGNLHKWLCAPKGAAFLYARRSLQEMLEPLVVSWGWDAIIPTSSRFIDHHEYQGTSDPSPWLAVPAAIRFQQEHDWNDVRHRCHDILRRARPLIAEALDATFLSPDSDEWYAQMLAFILPDDIDAFELRERLYQEDLVEIPAFNWNGRQTMRISIQGYNSWDDVERLLNGIRRIVGKREERGVMG